MEKVTLAKAGILPSSHRSMQNQEIALAGRGAECAFPQPEIDIAI